MDSPEVFSLKQLNQRIFAGLAAKETALAEREAAAAKVLEECEKERREIQGQRELIEAAQALQIAELTHRGDSVSESPEGSQATGDGSVREPSSDEPKRRIRIGDQRYAILKTLQGGWGHSVAEISEMTGLSAKRIFDQFRSDIPKGDVVETVSGARTIYQLSSSGEELIQKFEHNRRESGMPLPPLKVDAATVIDDGVFE